jgi:hypothetical protein
MLRNQNHHHEPGSYGCGDLTAEAKHCVIASLGSHKAWQSTRTGNGSISCLTHLAQHKLS